MYHLQNFFLKNLVWKSYLQSLKLIIPTICMCVKKLLIDIISAEKKG